MPKPDSGPMTANLPTLWNGPVDAQGRPVPIGSSVVTVGSVVFGPQVPVLVPSKHSASGQRMALAPAPQMDPIADMARALAEAEDRLARMGRVISILMAPPPSTKGMDPKARAQRLYAEWERRMKEAREALADG